MAAEMGHEEVPPLQWPPSLACTQCGLAMFEDFYGDGTHPTCYTEPPGKTEEEFRQDLIRALSVVHRVIGVSSVTEITNDEAAKLMRENRDTTLGPCARCQMPIERYGLNGTTLCPSCRARLQEQLA